MGEQINVSDYPNHPLNILEPIKIDESIESYQYYEYTPQSQENLDTGTPIQININAHDSYIIPSQSYLVIQGQLVRKDNGNAYEANDQITLVNNAMMYLFSEIKYSIGGVEMERLINPGITTSIMTYLSQPDDYSTSAGLLSCWSKDTTDHADSNDFDVIPAGPIAANFRPTKNPNYNQGFAVRRGLLMSANPRGSFTFVIPFSHMFGFAEYNKAIYGVKHSLTLNRYQDNNLALYKADANVADGKIKLTNITWRVPQIEIEISEKASLQKIIETKKLIPISYCARNDESINVSQGVRAFQWRLSVTSGVEKPRWIIVGFQTNKDLSQQQNPTIFDHVNLSNVCVELNSARYPSTDLITNFQTNNY
jgi:hypothetical protein